MRRLRPCLQRAQGGFFATQLDLELITGMKIQHGGVGLANQEIAVSLHCGDVGKFATTFADSASTGCTEIDALGFKQSFVEGDEVETLTTTFLLRNIAKGTNQI